MHLRRTATICIIFLSFHIESFSQARTTNQLLSRLSKEDRHEYLMYKSKKEKSKAITVGIAGPILTGIGYYLLRKEDPAVNGQNNSPAKFYGAMLSSFGVVLSVSSISLFITASKTKKDAKLLLKAN